MDAIDKIIKLMAGYGVEITRADVEQRIEETKTGPEAWLAMLEASYSDAARIGVVDMWKFSEPLSYTVGEQVEEDE